MWLASFGVSHRMEGHRWYKRGTHVSMCGYTTFCLCLFWYINCAYDSKTIVWRNILRTCLVVAITIILMMTLQLQLQVSAFNCLSFCRDICASESTGLSCAMECELGDHAPARTRLSQLRQVLCGCLTVQSELTPRVPQ